MKYLVTLSPKPFPIPMDQAVRLYQAAIAWTEERVKNGKIESIYIFPGGGGFAVANLNSHGELFVEMLSFPLYPFFEFEVKALVDAAHGYNSTIEFYKKMGAK